LRNAALILLGLTFLVYVLTYLAPGDPAQVIASQRLGRLADDEEVSRIRVQYGLDQPVAVQYMRWLWQTVQGDFGRSIRTGQPIRKELARRLRPSLQLGAAAMGLVLLLGIPSGIWAGLHPGSLWDHAIRLFGLAGVSIPDFWLGFVLVLVFAIRLHWLPSFGAKSRLHLILPAITLAAGQAARMSQLIRSVLRDEMRKSHIRTARGKGLSTAAVLFRHALPNIAVPFVTVAAYQFSSLISGAIIIEAVFSWPGLGSYYVAAVDFRDLPAIQATVLVFGVIVTLSNLLADVAGGLVDPRLTVE
jgi:peptide/nickel transport system permease protein